MAVMRVIGNNLNRGYRDDLNWNFAKLETLLADSTSINDEFRREIQAEIYDLNQRLDDMDVTEILALIGQMQQAIIDSNTATIHATTQGNYARGEGDFAKQEGVEAKTQGTYAKDQGDYANEKTLLTIEATDKALIEIANMEALKIAVVQATQDANNSSTRADESSDRADKLVDNTKSRNEFSLTVQYYKNNIVEYDGSSWISLKDGIGNPLPVLPLDYNEFWHLLAEKGAKGDQGASFSPGATGTLADRVNYDSEPEGFSYLASDTGELYFREGATGWGAGIPFGKGEKGDTGAKGEKGDTGNTGATGQAGSDGNSYVIKGQFTNISELPTTGQLGDGYLVGGDLYSWDGNAWILAGDIQGPKGEKGDGSDLTEVIKSINSLQDQNVGQDREIAWLKLQQEAKDRIEGGTVFADDMNGNSFGFTLNESESENISIKSGKLTMLEKITLQKDIKDGTVVSNNNSSTFGGSGKIVEMEDGTLITAVRGRDSLDRIFMYYFDGADWIRFVTENAHTTSEWVLQKLPKNRLMLIMTAVTEINSFIYNRDGSKFGTFGKPVDSVTAVKNISVDMSEDGSELHLAYAFKDSTLPLSFNIGYVKGNIVRISGVVSWGTREAVTKTNSWAETNFEYPNISLDVAGVPCIVYSTSDKHLSDSSNSHGTGPAIQFVKRSPALYHQNTTVNSEWGIKTVYSTAVTSQGLSKPQMIFVPKAINNLTIGRFWLVWDGIHSSNIGLIRTMGAYSDNAGITWELNTALSVPAVGSYDNATISANSNNEIFVIHEGTTTGALGMSYFKAVNNAWVLDTKVLQTTAGTYPSSIRNVNMNFSFPPMVYTGTDRIGFYGTWESYKEQSTLTSKVVYDIPKTDFVGLYVKRNSPVFPRIKAYINDIEMDLDGDSLGIEPSWTKELPNDVPVKLKLELSRDTVTAGNSDYISRILGGRS